MAESQRITVAIVDYGMGNLFSVRHALESVGVPAKVTVSKTDIMGADVVVLPGVGAFGDAMAALRKLDLVGPLGEVAASDKLLLGICLGMQLFMTESCEFGVHRGLDIIPGTVVPFVTDSEYPRRLKVPHVGWSRIYSQREDRNGRDGYREEAHVWRDTPLKGLDEGEFMYFVHSFYCEPDERGIVNSFSRYGDVEFCSSFRQRNVFGFQFHPERSGPSGLRVYERVVSMVLTGTAKKPPSSVE